MPTFDTPEPIDLSIALLVGDVHLVASDRRDTVVDVRPSDASRDVDVRAAEQTRVEHHGRTVLVKGPKPRGLRNYIGRHGSVDVTVELPEGSQVKSDAAVTDVRTEGRLGECRFKSAAGAIRLDRTGPLEVSSASGTVTLERADGNVKATTGSGTLQVGEVDGGAVLSNANGETRVGRVAGDLRVKAANGSVTVDRADAGVDVKTANGSIKVGEVVRGTVVLETGFGELEIGIRQGTAAFVDVRSQFGKVRNSLDAAEGPAQSDEETAEIRARTSYGDILVHRA